VGFSPQNGEGGRGDSPDKGGKGGILSTEWTGGGGHSPDKGGKGGFSQQNGEGGNVGMMGAIIRMQPAHARQRPLPGSPACAPARA